MPLPPLVRKGSVDHTVKDANIPSTSTLVRPTERCPNVGQNALPGVHCKSRQSALGPAAGAVAGCSRAST